MTTVNVGDTLKPITDAITANLYPNRTVNVSDTLRTPQDSISAGIINLENPTYWKGGTQIPARWVAPLSIIPDPDLYWMTALYLAAHPVLHPARYFEPRVKSYGTFTRAISAPVEFFRTGDVSVSVADADNSVRRRISDATIRKATAELRFGPEGGSLNAFLRLFKREVGLVSQPSDGLLSISMRDYIYDRLEDEIPPEIDTGRYPNLPVSPARDFSPIIIGEVAAENGAIPLIYIDTATNGYLVARHPCKSIDAVYRKRSNESAFGLVPSSEYTVDNEWNKHCIINFVSPQTDAEIRANVKGYYFGDTGEMRCVNFADFILEILETVMGLQSDDRINYATFEETRDRLNAIYNWPEPPGLNCAGALLTRMTFAELLTQIQRSCNVDIFSDKNDRICVHYTIAAETPTADLDDTLRLYQGSVSQQLADPCYNRFPFKFNLNYATGKWEKENVYNNPVDQQLIGEIVPDEMLQLYWIRDPTLAYVVAEARAMFLSLDCFRIEAEVPLLPVIEEIELADIVQISHFGGMASGGYALARFKILELSMDIDNLKYRIKAIKRSGPRPT